MKRLQRRMEMERDIHRKKMEGRIEKYKEERDSQLRREWEQTKTMVWLGILIIALCTLIVVVEELPRFARPPAQDAWQVVLSVDILSSPDTVLRCLWTRFQSLSTVVASIIALLVASRISSTLAWASFTAIVATS